MSEPQSVTNVLNQIEGVLVGQTPQAEFLAVMLQAPASEIDDMCADTGEAAAKILGIEPDEYKYETHYALLLARLRRQWAEAMMEEALRAVDQK